MNVRVESGHAGLEPLRGSRLYPRPIGRGFTRSLLKVAEAFSRRHRDVVKRINSFKGKCPDDFLTANFYAVKFEHRGNQYDAYEMTKNGFIILVNSFQCAKALELQIDYIAAFDWMAEKLLQQQYSPTPSTPPEPSIDTVGPHWMQLDSKPVITFKLIEQLTGHSVGQLTYLYHKNKDQFAENCWVLSTSQPGFQQLKDQGQGGNVVRLFNVEGYQLLMRLYQNEYQPRLEAEQAELLPAPEVASEQQLFQAQGVVPFCDLSGVDLPYPAARHEQPGSNVGDLGDERLETYMDVFDEALRDKARYNGLECKAICHYLLKGLATRDSRLQAAAIGTLYAMREPLGLKKITDRK
ncbi:MAG: Rha family transcriptional regulator [Marinobacterium sp.]|nr:Rha family transcriptional regulator [Marinobacterium sp.]